MPLLNSPPPGVSSSFQPQGLCTCCAQTFRPVSSPVSHILASGSPWRGPPRPVYPTAWCLPSRPQDHRRVLAFWVALTPLQSLLAGFSSPAPEGELHGCCGQHAQPPVGPSERLSPPWAHPEAPVDVEQARASRRTETLCGARLWLPGTPGPAALAAGGSRTFRAAGRRRKFATQSQTSSAQELLSSDFLGLSHPALPATGS